MKLTICLITKGRKEYLTEALNSYEKFIETGDVNVILIDNGSDNLSKQILLNWKSKFEKKVKYVRSEKNESTGVAFFWEEIKSLSSEWIMLPSDDDVLVFDIYEEWKRELSNNSLLNAFSASAQIIDVNSEYTGEIRSPAIYAVDGQVEQVVQSLHEPPFLWPCLFLRITEIPNLAIYSGFVFDWWVGLHLILKSQIKSTKSIGIKYRVHQKQASFQTTNRRKFFEGYNMLSTVINSDEFRQFLEALTILELKNFLALCIKIKPLYAQPEYYISLIKELFLNVAKTSNSNYLRNDISESYLLSAGVYTKRGDLEKIYDGLNLKVVDSIGNIKLSYCNGVCANLYSVKKFFNVISENIVMISCNHSKHIKDSIFIDCRKLEQLNEIEICDSILISINTHLEDSGGLSFTITPFEKTLILFFRDLKINFPAEIKKYLLKLKKLIRGKYDL